MIKITDRCWKRALAANPAPEKPDSFVTAVRDSSTAHLRVRLSGLFLVQSFAQVA
jgi:hypothetical protein